MVGGAGHKSHIFLDRRSLWRRGVEGVIWGGQGGSGLARTLLTPVQLGYRLALAWEAMLRSRGWSRPGRLSVPVLSVGGLTVGGGGKTSLTEYLVGTLLGRGLRVGVLSRGYGRERGPEPVVVSRGQGVEVGPEQGGDEPVAVAEVHPRAIVVVARDRLRAGGEAVRLGAQVCLLDDGFQHRRLARDWDLVIVPRESELAGGLFPCGPLREGPEAMGRADLRLWVRDGVEERPEEIRPQVVLRRVPEVLSPLNGGDPLLANWLGGREVLLVAGLARVEGLVAMVQALGARLCRVEQYPDHAWYGREDPIRWRAICHSGRVLLTTAKDAVKLRGMADLPRRSFILRTRLEIVEGGETWEELVDRVVSAATDGRS